jgi:aryl-alcohol dehydrogenase-like predicted oxidoreductase
VDIWDTQRLSWWQRAADDALFDDGQPGDEVLARTSNLADMYDQYGVELTAAAVQFPVRHPVVAAVVAGTQRRTSCLDVAASVGRRPGRGLA